MGLKFVSHVFTEFLQAKGIIQMLHITRLPMAKLNDSNGKKMFKSYGGIQNRSRSQTIIINAVKKHTKLYKL